MADIQVLDKSVWGKIAAGEVVEKPASIVKELVENSIDAGAKNITIEIKDGGTTFMQVVDDGHGIEEEDIKSAFLPHATSKNATKSINAPTGNTAATSIPSPSASAQIPSAVPHEPLLISALL